MLTRRLALTLLAAPAAWLSACSKEPSDPSSAASADSRIETAQAYDTVAAQAKGFKVGAMMSAHTAYVLFDPQCPHCGHLWEASQPLHGKIRFVWVPVVLLGAKSLPQGAALLQATNPADAMTSHEKSLLTGQGGTSASASVPADIEATIKANTLLLDRLGADSVPYIVAKHVGSGQVMTHAGSMDTATLTSFLGLPPA